MFHPKASNKCPSYRAAELLSVTRTLYPPENMSVPHKYLEAMKFPLRGRTVKYCRWFFLAGSNPGASAHTLRKPAIHLAVQYDSVKRRASKAVNQHEVFAAPGTL